MLPPESVPQRVDTSGVRISKRRTRSRAFSSMSLSSSRPRRQKGFSPIRLSSRFSATLNEGTVPSLSVALNLLLKRIGEKPFWRRGREDDRLIEENARDLVRRFDIRTPDVSTRCGTLSGGNIQKVVLARELSAGPVAVIYSKPTHG